MFEQLDFASFYNADTSERDRFCQDLVSSLRQNGFVRLINHGISSDDIDRAFETVCLFHVKKMGNTEILIESSRAGTFSNYP